MARIPPASPPYPESVESCEAVATEVDMINETTWVVVANSSRARIFRLESRNNLVEMDGLVHSKSRLREGDLVSDRKGRSFNRMGYGRHAMEQELDPHKQEAVHFASMLAEHLQKALQAGEYGRLYLSASPKFLGLLRQELDPHTSAVIVQELDKDMTELTTAQILEHLPYIP